MVDLPTATFIDKREMENFLKEQASISDALKRVQIDGNGQRRNKQGSNSLFYR